MTWTITSKQPFEAVWNDGGSIFSTRLRERPDGTWQRNAYCEATGNYGPPSCFDHWHDALEDPIMLPAFETLLQEHTTAQVEEAKATIAAAGKGKEGEMDTRERTMDDLRELGEVRRAIQAEFEGRETHPNPGAPNFRCLRSESLADTIEAVAEVIAAKAATEGVTDGLAGLGLAWLCDDLERVAQKVRELEGEMARRG